MARLDHVTGKWCAELYEPAEHGADRELDIDSGPEFSTEKDALAAEAFAEDATWAARFPPPVPRQTEPRHASNNRENDQ